MFCFQCEQTSGGKGCTKMGACGKSAQVAGKQDDLSAALIDLAKAVQIKHSNKTTDELMMQGLFTTITNVNFDPADIDAMILKIKAETAKLGGKTVYKGSDLFTGDQDIVSLRSTLLIGIRGMAAYAWHAFVLGKEDKSVTAWLYKGMQAVGEDHSLDQWVGLLMEFGGVNLKCMASLDEANTSTYGHPVPTKVPLTIEKGPFIVITGHDLLDLKQLLEQTQGKGVNIYTHGEMLPAHAYPELKK